MANEGRSIPGGGDALARGVKSVTFPGVSKCLEGCECTSCRPDLHFLHTDANEEEQSSVASVVDNSALFAPKKPSICYRGTPLNDRILIKRVERDHGSSIVIPDSAKGKSDTGIVVSVSPMSKLGLAPNELILFDKYAAVGQEIELVDEMGVTCEHLLVQECDVLLVLEAYKPSAESGACVQ